MTLEAKQKIIDELSALEEQDQKFKYLIQKGRSLPEMSETKKSEDFQVKGCMSQLWLHPSFTNGRVYFEVDSDAAIPKGIAAILVEVYGGCTPDEIIALDPAFLRDVGVEQHLSLNRRNGLTSLTKQIKLYAVAFKSLETKRG